MAMTKADMEQHRDLYQGLLQQSITARRDGRLNEAIRFAVQSLEYVDGMMQCLRKYDKTEFVSVDAIDLIIQLAPVLLDDGCLVSVEQLLRNQKRVKKHTSAHLAGMLEESRLLLKKIHLLLQHLEQKPSDSQVELQQVTGLNDDQWALVVDAWTRIQFARVDSDSTQSLSLVTWMDEPTRAKCPACGVVAKATKSKLLSEATCPKCKASVVFVLLSSVPAVGRS